MTTSSQPPQSPFLTKVFILVGVYWSCVGWLLSALHQLNIAGYGIALGVGVIALALTRPEVGRIRTRRFRRGLPLAFLSLGALAILGGILYPPSNYDGLASRIPRMFHWLAEGRWHWITAEFSRLNTRSVGWEWMAAPLLVFTKSYRWLFLPNVLAFILLPGLVFSVFTRLGVRGRVAWYWMWLLPTGYCYLLQAGSIGNDMIAAIPALAAIDFALRAQKSRRFSDAWYSILSVALMTGLKTTNMPLLLVWMVAFFPVLTWVRKRTAATLAVGIVAIGASFVPLAVFNQKYGGDWTGLKADTWPEYSWRLPVNAIALGMQNFAPPLFPLVERWNDWVKKTIPADVTEQINRSFEPGIKFMAEMAIEEIGGLGCGLSFLVMLSVLGGWFQKTEFTKKSLKTDLYTKCLLLAPWVGLLYLLYKSGGSTVARFATGFYGLLIPVFLIGAAQSRVVRSRWWRVAAGSVLVLALIPLVLSPARPLWPALSTFERLTELNISNRVLDRARTVYTVYRQRSAGFEPVRPLLPEGIRTLGFLSFDDPEAALWLPMGTLRIEHVTHRDGVEELKHRGVEYILASPEKAQGCLGKPFDEWMAELKLEKVKTIPLRLKASTGEQNWYLVKLPRDKQAP